MENNIAQVFIYYSYDIYKNLKTKLLVIDQKGNVKIWSIRIFIEKFSRSYYRYINPLSNTFNLNKTCTKLLYNQDISGFIDQNKSILMFMGKTNFHFIHLNAGYYYLEIFKIKNPIKNSLTVLPLQNCDVLIGTKDGYIYLIEYEYSPKLKKINILDKYNICEGSPVKHISYDTTCSEKNEECNIFIANCGKSKTFKIGPYQSFIIKHKKIVYFIVFVGLNLFLIYFILHRKKLKKDNENKKDEEIELTEK